MTVAGARILDYTIGAGGGIFELPDAYLDRIADVMRMAHPKTITRELQLVMASAGYIGSNHPLIRGLDEYELREFHRDLARKAVTDGTG